MTLAGKPALRLGGAVSLAIVIPSHFAYLAKAPKRLCGQSPAGSGQVAAASAEACGFAGQDDGRLKRWDKCVDEAEMTKRLEMLRIEHRDLDAAIDALSANTSDQLQVARLKKRKLMLKDQIALLEDYLIPDIIA